MRVTKFAEFPHYCLDLFHRLRIVLGMGCKLLSGIRTFVTYVWFRYELSQLPPSYKGFDILLKFKKILCVVIVVTMELTILTFIPLRANT